MSNAAPICHYHKSSTKSLFKRNQTQNVEEEKTWSQGSGNKDKRKNIPVHAQELLTVDRPLARLWVFEENREDTKSSMPSSSSSKES